MAMRHRIAGPTPYCRGKTGLPSLSTGKVTIACFSDASGKVPVYTHSTAAQNSLGLYIDDAEIIG